MSLLTSSSAALITPADIRNGNLDPSALRRGHARKEVVRVKRGANYESEAWRQLDDREQHLVRMSAVAASHRDPVFGYESAAAALGIPILGDWPDDVHVIAPPASGGRSEKGIRRHCTGVNAHEVVRVGDLAVTAPLRTAVGTARARPFESAVSFVDSVLRMGLATPAELTSAAPEGGRGVARMRRALVFADGRADNPGESLSRVRIRQLGFPGPDLQREFVLPAGQRYLVDFFWADHGIVGEFDGFGKYRRNEYLRGRSPADVVVAEKKREDAIRSVGYSVVRWGWQELRDPASLRTSLIRAGLAPTRAF